MHRQHLAFVCLQGWQYALHLIDRGTLHGPAGQTARSRGIGHIPGKNANEMNDPTGKNAVIGKDQECADHPDAGGYRPPAGCARFNRYLFHAFDRRALAVAADQGFREQDRQADQQDAKNIENDKGPAAIRAGLGREANQIAQSDGRSDRCQNECGS